MVGVFWNEDFISMRTYCLTNGTENTIYNVMICSMMLAVSDVLTTLIDIYVYTLNKNQMRRFDAPSLHLN
jgi:hypothetical protein